jgi:hypothetical protein
MNPEMLTGIRDLIQRDVNRRGLATDPTSNLLTACAGDFADACRSLAATRDSAVAIVTGFFIPTGNPPCGETDGPLGALFLARALTPLGVRVALLTDDFCRRALAAGLRACELAAKVPVLTLPAPERPWDPVLIHDFRPTHLLALERVGPSHTPGSIDGQPGEDKALADFLREVPKEHHGRCHTMRGVDITDSMSPAHRLFEDASGVTTIGIGDGGNEIGMGKISWEVIRRNVPGGGIVACRVPTNYLIVAGISNWGAYGLAAGVWALGNRRMPENLLDIARERKLLEIMVENGPLVDGVTGQQTPTVDGLPFEQYAEVLSRLRLSMPSQSP